MISCGANSAKGICLEILNELNLKVKPLVLLPRVDIRVEDEVVLAVADSNGLAQVAGFEPARK